MARFSPTLSTVNSNLDIRPASDVLQNAHELLEHLVLERTAELIHANQLLRQEIEERKRVEQALRNSYLEIENLKNRLQAETVKVTEATLTYVATDANRKPRQIPPLSAITGNRSEAS